MYKQNLGDTSDVIKDGINFYPPPSPPGKSFSFSFIFFFSLYFNYFFAVLKVYAADVDWKWRMDFEIVMISVRVNWIEDLMERKILMDYDSWRWWIKLYYFKEYLVYIYR